ncbi:AAA family ATPase [Geodermatophilus sabuli]|uniref:MinD-like ATPase involved in chromosome partitioning or flagellar assembly n=1 Tax=Geodermatophilus sabuli TaxID=1564158 RepID=A0A285EH68_9ACTN|nr:chromosome partitioning protein [Geodermatophilus sabuli]MBB3086085.1 MinD-like ATPase involved in chromosome partitioning or flagellar assembly [Geodermatophilus sabuli]SNX98425.1 MinD-like ATPase involved in chromosome partitioning or flagellar assembly [Geodermatophilus sabuli]
MAVQVFTAVTGAGWESALVGALDRTDHGVTVVRRCVDVSELLAAAATGTGQAALLSADLRRLDTDAVARLAAAGVAVVGLVDPGDHQAADRLRALGVVHVLPADTEPDGIARTLRDAVAGRPPAGRGIADPRAALPDPVPAAVPVERQPGAGRVVAVWGPTGAPGRTTVSVGLADEAARLDVGTLLIDADVYGGVVAQVLGLLDESPGLAGAARQAAAGTLDEAALARLAWAVRPRLGVLTGLARADRWPELRPHGVAAVLEEARRAADLIVVDCSFNLEEDEELSFDTAAPRRNGVTLTVLEAADTVLCVSGADPVALQRTIRALGELRDTVPGVEPVVVVNQVRRGPVPGDPRREIAEALERFAGHDVAAFLPADRRATDAALADGRTLAEVAPSSPLRTQLRELAAVVAGVPRPDTGRRRVGARRRAG